MRGRVNPMPRPPRKGTARYSRTPIPLPPVNGYSIAITGPANGISTRKRRPTVTVIPMATVAPSVDIQIEWRRSPSTAPAQLTQLNAQSPGVAVALSPSSDLAYAVWYFRARAGNAATNVWGSWTGFQTLTVFPIPGFASAYMDLNIGVANYANLPRTVLYTDFNVGIPLPPPLDTFHYVDFNVGLEKKPRLGAEYVDLVIRPAQTKNPRGSAYIDLNIDSTLTPKPHIWYIKPHVGAEGLAFEIVGQGFGNTQGEFDGVVRLGSLQTPVVSWSKIARSGTAPLFIDETAATTNVEHQKVIALVPDGASSGLVRVILEDD